MSEASKMPARITVSNGPPYTWDELGVYADPTTAYVRADIAEQMAEALRACQSALAMMIAPDAIKSTSVLHAFTQAVEAECKARAALTAWEASNPARQASNGDRQGEKGE
jgi:hypothetical protein